MASEHDARNKALFSSPVILEQLLTSFVDQPWVRGVDFSRAERVDKSFVTGRFRRLESDMVWKLPVQGETVYLYLLLEFQSKVDRFMALRMLRYILEFYSTLVPGLGKGERLPAVFPLMLYNGDAPWTAPVELSDLIETRVERPFLPSFSYYKIAENEFPQGVLERTRNLVSALFLVETTDPDLLRERADLILGLLRNERPEELELFRRWLGSFFHGEENALTEGTDKMQEVRTMLATALKRKEEEWIRKGKQEGIEEGIEKGERKKALEAARRMLAKGIEPDEIAELLVIDRAEVLQLQAEISPTKE